MRSRAARFDDLVLDAVEDIEELLGRSVEPVQLAVEDVPPPQDAWAGGVPLARYEPAVGRSAPRVVVHRRPIEARAEDEPALASLVYEVVAEHVALALGVDPDELR